MASGNISWGGAAVNLLKNAVIVSAVVAATVVGGEAVASYEIGNTTVGAEVQKFGTNVWEYVHDASHWVAETAYWLLGKSKEIVIDVSNSIGVNFFGQSAAADNAFSKVVEDLAVNGDALLKDETGKAVVGAAAAGAGLYTAGSAMRSAKEGGYVAAEMARRAAVAPFQNRS